jgi:RsiW-degrading membrane proteinase PrsW (M82 family)
MLEQMLSFFSSWFANPSVLGIGLAIVFGAVWLTCFWLPFFKRPWLWAVLAGSAILTLVAVAFVQIPLQVRVGQALGQEVLLQRPLLASIPAILFSGLVQEGSKLVPIVLYWWRKGKNIDPKLGLAIGAVAGAGFGIFEAQWIHNAIFAAGWNWEVVQNSGVIALAGFWERFFTVAFHTAVSALAGYGLARGWGWQFYLLAAFLHALTNYGAVLFGTGVMTIVQVEIYIAVIAVLVAAVVLWLRWRKPAELAELEVSTA